MFCQTDSNAGSTIYEQLSRKGKIAGDQYLELPIEVFLCKPAEQRLAEAFTKSFFSVLVLKRILLISLIVIGWRRLWNTCLGKVPMNRSCIEVPAWITLPFIKLWRSITRFADLWNCRQFRVRTVSCCFGCVWNLELVAMWTHVKSKWCVFRALGH